VNITLHINQMVSVYKQSMSACSVANWLFFYFLSIVAVIENDILYLYGIYKEIRGGSRLADQSSPFLILKQIEIDVTSIGNHKYRWYNVHTPIIRLS